jgi:hypothetical protein
VTAVIPPEIIAFLVGFAVASAFGGLGKWARSVDSASTMRGVDIAPNTRLERKMDFLLNHFGLMETYEQTVMTTMPTPDIEALLRQGLKIQAIKVYREQTGAGLKESKDAVEEMARLLR